MTFGVARPPEPSKSFDGNSDPIAGRPSVTTYTDLSCGVETGHIPFEEVAGATGLVETVEVDAEVPRGQGDPAGRLDETDQTDPPACKGALAIARALWPRLPNA